MDDDMWIEEYPGGPLLPPAPAAPLSDYDRLAGFAAAILAATPNGEWIEVQYSPFGDWSVAATPAPDIAAKDAERAEVPARLDATEAALTAAREHIAANPPCVRHRTMPGETCACQACVAVGPEIEAREEAK